MRTEAMTLTIAIVVADGMAHWPVGQIGDPALSRETRKWMQYDPAPPYTAKA